METLRNYLESMFKRYPDTPEAEKAKAELWQMMEDKYNELMAEGKKDNEAVGIVISEFGDLEEVADSLGISTMLQKIEEKAENADAAEKTAEAVPSKEAAPVTETLTNITPVAEVVRTSEDTSGQVKGFKIPDTPFNADSDKQDEYGEFAFHLASGALSVFWPTVTCLYLCWSFLTFKWWITWIIWPLAAVLHSVLKRLLMGDVKAKDGKVYKSRLIAAVLDSYWSCVVFAYFAISFLTGAWHVTWLIYVIAPFVRKYLKQISTEEG